MNDYRDCVALFAGRLNANEATWLIARPFLPGRSNCSRDVLNPFFSKIKQSGAVPSKIIPDKSYKRVGSFSRLYTWPLIYSRFTCSVRKPLSKRLRGKTPNRGYVFFFLAIQRSAARLCYGYGIIVV